MDLELIKVFLCYFLNFCVFCLLLAADSLSDSEKLMILSDGFCNDIMLSAYSELGIPLDKPYRMGYITSSVRDFCYFTFLSIF